MTKPEEETQYLAYYHPDTQFIGKINPAVYTAEQPLLEIKVASFFPAAISQLPDFLPAVVANDKLDLAYLTAQSQEERKEVSKKRFESQWPPSVDVYAHSFAEVSVDYFPHSDRMYVPPEAIININFTSNLPDEQVAAGLKKLVDESETNDLAIMRLRMELREAILKAVAIKQPLEEKFADSLQDQDGVLPPDKARVHIFLPIGTTVLVDDLFTVLFPNGEVTLEVTDSEKLEDSKVAVNIEGVLTVNSPTSH